MPCHFTSPLALRAHRTAYAIVGLSGLLVGILCPILDARIKKNGDTMGTGEYSVYHNDFGDNFGLSLIAGWVCATYWLLHTIITSLPFSRWTEWFVCIIMDVMALLAIACLTGLAFSFLAMFGVGTGPSDAFTSMAATVVAFMFIIFFVTVIIIIYEIIWVIACCPRKWKTWVSSVKTLSRPLAHPIEEDHELGDRTPTTSVTHVSIPTKNSSEC